MTGDLNRTVVQPAAERATAGRRRWIVAVAVIFAISMAGLGAILFSQHGQIADLQASGAARDSTNQELAHDVAALAEQVKRLGGTPVVQPPAAAPAVAHVDADELRQVARQAVDDYCAPRNQCRGADGQTPDFNALTTAVLARIPIPQNGKPGEDAPPVTDTQVLAQVTAYCDEHDECRGAKGDTGDPGAMGATGPTCPDGYELRDAVITAPDGTTYQGKACVDPNTGSAPSTVPDPPTTGG